MLDEGALGWECEGELRREGRDDEGEGGEERTESSRFNVESSVVTQREQDQKPH